MSKSFLCLPPAVVVRSVVFAALRCVHQVPTHLCLTPHKGLNPPTPEREVDQWKIRGKRRHRAPPPPTSGLSTYNAGYSFAQESNIVAAEGLPGNGGLDRGEIQVNISQNAYQPQNLREELWDLWEDTA